MIVIDASAAVLGLLNDGDARRSLASGAVAAPHLVDSEVAHALRSQVLRGTARDDQARTALDRWARLGISRFAVVGLLGRVWSLRVDLTAYDATPRRARGVARVRSPHRGPASGQRTGSQVPDRRRPTLR